jgi:hypothetical protein
MGLMTLTERLNRMPSEVAGMTFRQVTPGSDSATVVYLADETATSPDFGMVVVVQVEPDADAEAVLEKVVTDRWGHRELHQVTDESRDGSTHDGEAVAYRAFSRGFAPGQFVLPNRPVFFLIWYRERAEWAFMVIGHNAVARESLATAVVETFGVVA